MIIELVEARADELGVLANLWTLYSYDMSEYVGLDVDEAGRFPPRAFDDHGTEARRAFFIRSEGRLLGFALVHRGSRIDASPDVWDVAEFFVLQRHRKSGVGAAAAEQMFRRFAGRWEVRQLATNTRAMAFWKAVVDRLTDGRFTTAVITDPKWPGQVIGFHTDQLIPR